MNCLLLSPCNPLKINHFLCHFGKRATSINRHATCNISSTSLHQTYYSVLGLRANCTHKDIRSAYLDLCKKHHPDKIGASKHTNLKFQQINEAYNCLNQPSSRAHYDSMLRRSCGDHSAASSSTKNHNSHQDSPHQYQANARYYYYDNPYYNTRRSPNHQPSAEHERLFRITFVSAILITVFVMIFLPVSTPEQTDFHSPFNCFSPLENLQFLKQSNVAKTN